MTNAPDHSVRELGKTRLKLRGDLVFTPQTSGGQPYWMVEDPLNSRFFRLGHAEYTFVSLLDGVTTIHDALSHLATVMPHHRLTEVDAAGLCRWLVEMDLAHTSESSGAGRLAARAARLKRGNVLARWNPLVFRLPLCQPDDLIAALTRSIGWLFSPWAAIGWVLLAAIGAYKVFSAWDHFTASSQGVFAPDNWLWLLVCWIVLKIVHEISHGVVCNRYGGTVREMGILFILLTPLAYVDVTSSWRFRSRRRRIHVALAGMYTELLIAAVAAIVWSTTGSGWLNHVCFNIVVMASLATLVFNANPLMKFDGYYILSDALAMPNLFVNGQTYLRYWARRFLLGVPASLPDWPRGQAAFIRAFGWAAFVWRVFVCLSLTVTAATLLHGAGIVLACAAVVLWLGLPALHFAQYFVFGKPGEQPRRIRFLLTVGTAAAICVIVFGILPWPGTCGAPAIVAYSPHTVIRAASAGFVKEVHVESSQQVETGQLLVVLENRQLARDVADLELQLRQSEIRGRQYEQKGELASQQAEAKEREALETQLDEKRAQVEELAVRAPSAGKVIRRNLSALIGTYLQEGDEVVSLGDEAKKELRLSVSQDDLDVFAERVGKPVRVDVARHNLWHSQLAKVIPRATLTPTHPALSAANGGPLPVTPVAQPADGSDAHEYLAPRFTGIVTLSESEARRLHAGERADVSYRPLAQSIGQHLCDVSSRWIRQRLSP